MKQSARLLVFAIGVEGSEMNLVAKRRESRYLPGERGWVKTKNRETWWRYELERESASSPPGTFARQSGQIPWLTDSRWSRRMNGGSSSPLRQLPPNP